jgi:hypothetical protein
LDVETVTTADRSLLPAVRSLLDRADQPLLCVAFVQEKGLYLLKPELEALAARGGSSRLLVTKTFDMSTDAGLTLVRNVGMNVRALNPGGSCHSPKLRPTRLGRVPNDVEKTSRGSEHVGLGSWAMPDLRGYPVMGRPVECDPNPHYA